MNKSIHSVCLFKFKILKNKNLINLFNYFNYLLNIIKNKYKNVVNITISKKYKLFLNKDFIKKFYLIHKNKSFYNNLVEFNRDKMFFYIRISIILKDPKMNIQNIFDDLVDIKKTISDTSKELFYTIRGLYGIDINSNAIHISDSANSAIYENSLLNL